MLISHAYGDGLASETLPPSIIGNRNVTFSITSIPILTGDNYTGTQLGVTLQDANTSKPIPHATVSISVFKGGAELLDHVFQSDSGDFSLYFYPKTIGNISIDEEQGVPLAKVFGEHSGIYNINGPVFLSGGLYHFKLEVTAMTDYNNQVNKSFSAAISLPEYYKYAINDTTFGTQQIQVVGYYDQINNFSYNTSTRFINFSMPFDWSEDNIDALTVLHQEVQIPRAFDNYIVPKYDAYVDNIKMPDKAITIDDYSSESNRVIHLILYKQDVKNLLTELKNPSQDMTFSLRPNTANAFPIVQYTKNNQFEMALSWNPTKILTGSTVTFNFKVSSTSLVNQTLSDITYDFSVLEGKNGVIYHEVGKTSNNGNNINVAFPQNYTGAITIAFENLNDSSFASTEFTSTVSNPSTENYLPAANAQSAVPEFPFASLAVLVVIFGFMITIAKTRLFRH